ncbi:MAG TPA: DUF2357 domain-containing protein [Verrucomicrobiae bacterium]
MWQLPEHRIPFLSPAGELLAYVVLTPTRKEVNDRFAPIIQIEDEEAKEHGETAVQLQESERYEYEVFPENGATLRLRCRKPDSACWRSLRRGDRDAGLIETHSYCGTLLLELVEGEGGDAEPATASALLDVRSLKLDYRTEYRGMLRRLSDEIAGLVADARSSAKAGFRSTFEERTDAGWLQIQLELLRETLDGADFAAALQRILSFPHERLSSVSDSVSTDRPIRWTPPAVRQLLTSNPRREVPPSHPLRRNLGLESVAQRVLVPRKSRDLDTLENRFVKFALSEFRAFLTHAQGVFESCAGWGASAALSRRLAATVEDWLGRSLFREVGEMRFAPLGSPVLQRKAGYREVLRWWLRFRTAAELSWAGGEELFHAGQRDVASLYEYWLFFELLGWFCGKCRGGDRPAVEELVEGLEEGSPNLRLRKQMQLGPFAGSFAGQSRRLNAHFSYNRRFEVTADRKAGGSWTRRLHPDYTLTFWPEGLSEAEAERLELLVHVHFDAKYRVENIEGLFGADGADDADEEVEGNYKRQDLLKMHAYRDAIKRSQGAYVLYPGRSNAAAKFKGFHEILPGLGAFGVAPDENGAPQGLDSLEKFLDEVLAHLGNRTTAQERVSYHIAESYTLKEESVQYGSLRLQETDIYGAEYRALPPAEHMVLTAWFENDAQRDLAQAENGFTYVRLGRRAGSLHVHPNLTRVRHMLLRTHGPSVAPGLLVLREPGFRVFTRTQLRAELSAHAKGAGVTAWQASAGRDDDEHIYALFRTKADLDFRGQAWNPDEIMRRIEEFERDVRQKPVENLGRTSAYPRVLPLRELLKALIN